MAEYRLINLPMPGYVSEGDLVRGIITDDKGKVLSNHCSSNLCWLEQDLLNDVNFDASKDTYTKNWQ